MMADNAAPVVVALGSNLGDRAAHLRYAILRLSELLASLRVSRIIETRPVGVPVAQGFFLNAVAVGVSTRSPSAILHSLLAIEHDRGRTRPSRWAPRTLDLDLVLVGGQVVETDALTLPHPRFRDRLFVLGPLCEIAPDLRDPVTGLTARQLLVRAMLLTAEPTATAAPGTSPEAAR
jgi:2-amino-4-hydroxy-6-hydroxymethyldihydropteridine diphosphokinase